MNIIVVGQRHGESKTYTLGTSAKVLFFGILFALPLTIGAGGYWLAEHLADEGILDLSAAKAWEHDLNEQRQELQKIRKQTDQEMDALTIKLAELQGKLMRIDALGERLVDIGNLSSEEFDFGVQPAMGGPSIFGESYQVTDINQVLDGLAERIDSREQQLEVLDNLISANKLGSETFVAGRPIEKGWMSSRYGQRTDPFTGRIAWHGGIDFAGKMGTEIKAVASGVVTWSEDRYGYGKLVEINHGNGYKTRYAHCATLKVNVGDIVRKGDVVALMGSTGRSTGPHVHFEIYKNGRSVDPASYIHRTLR